MGKVVRAARIRSSEWIILCGAWIIIIATLLSIGLAIPVDLLPEAESHQNFRASVERSDPIQEKLQQKDNIKYIPRMRNGNLTGNFRGEKQELGKSERISRKSSWINPDLHNSFVTFLMPGHVSQKSVKKIKSNRIHQDNKRLSIISSKLIYGKERSAIREESVKQPVDINGNPAANVGVTHDLNGRQETSNSQSKLVRSTARNVSKSKSYEKSTYDDDVAAADYTIATDLRRVDPPATQIQPPQLLGDGSSDGATAWSRSGVPLVVDKIYWSEAVERLLPLGFSDEDAATFRKRLSTSRIESMEPSAWNRCGRPYNKFIVLEDGTKFCARYRHPQNSLVIGEILSYHLSILLGLDNVPTVVGSRALVEEWLWKDQHFEERSEDHHPELEWPLYEPLLNYSWTSGAPLALIQWIDSLGQHGSHVKIPAKLLAAYRNGWSLNGTSLYDNKLTTNGDNASKYNHETGQENSVYNDDITADEIISLVQWSDLILFDYITGHYDRFASMQDGAARENRSSILDENVRNLRQMATTSKLILIDNESGLLDAYWQMYQGHEFGTHFIHFHRDILRAVCLFRRQTLARVHKLADQAEPAEFLINYVLSQEPIFAEILHTAEKELNLFKSYFKIRLKEVTDWIAICRR